MYANNAHIDLSLMKMEYVWQLTLLALLGMNKETVQHVILGINQLENNVSKFNKSRLINFLSM